jgi:hypothetical protein
VSPGQKLRLSGYGYQTCHDTNHQPPARSFHHLAIIVIQGSSRTVLAHVSARPPEGTFDIAVQLPATLHPGNATVRTSLMIETPLRLTVRAG